MAEIDLIPMKDLPDILKISRMTLHRWIKEGRISVVRLSRRKVFVRREELERFVRESEK
jgi:excisionase family DNA binding protein